MKRFYRRWWRPVAAALIIGVSAWCAAGTVAVMSADVVSPRLLAPAPWWVGVLAASLALLVPGWRARPLTAAPALFATMPWWPTAVPVEVLLWTGVMAWVPIAAALLAAEGHRLVAAFARLPGTSDPARAPRLAAAGALIIAGLAAWAADGRVPQGDEPQYLIITQSLLQDQDLQIENNHKQHDYLRYYDRALAPDFLVRGQNRAIYSIHSPGLSALVLPGFAVSGFRGAQLTLMMVFALTGALVWHAAWRLTSDTRAAWFAWAAVMTSTTMAVLSFMVFPDAPGACAVAAAVWLLVSVRDARPRALVLVSSLMAALPWLHTRFSVLAGALGLAIVSLLFVDGTRTMAARWRRAAWFSAVPVVSAALWLWSFFAIYGTVDPRAPYGPDPEMRSWIWGALAGLFVDQQFGLLTFAPVLVAAGAAVVLRGPGKWRGISALCLTVLLAYAAVVTTYWMWWAGLPGLPARFLTAAVPLLAVPLAVVWSRSTPVGRAALLTLLAISLAMTVMVLVVDGAAMAWNSRDGQATWLNWLNPLVNLPRVWPSFFWNGETAFLKHAVWLAALAAAVWLTARQVARRLAGDLVAVRLTIALTWMVGAMLLAAGGWWFTGGAAMDPSRAQLRLHAAGRGANDRMRIETEQLPVADGRSRVLARLVDVPAGDYRIQVSSSRPGPGEILVRIGQSVEPWTRLALAATPEQELRLMLPTGTAVLDFEAGSAEMVRALDVRVIPTSAAHPDRNRALTFSRWPDAEAFFLDGNVYPEASGFWVGGGKTAALVLRRPSQPVSRPTSLLLRNGAVANTVTVRYGAWQEDVTLAAGQEHVVALPPSDALGAWPLSIRSASGFRPAVTSGGTDVRNLGVWVQ